MDAEGLRAAAPSPRGDAVSEPAARGALGTVRNAVLLLNLLSEGPAYQQLTELAERSGLTVPTVHRLLRSLVLADLVEQDPRSLRYGLGGEVARLAQRYLARLPILSALSPYLLPLRDAVQATVHVAVLVRGSVVYVDRIDGTDSGLYRDTHRVHGAFETASGRILVARAGKEAWRLASETSRSADREIAEAERAAWHTADYLVTAGVGLAGADEVAVAVVNGRQQAVAALAATLAAGASPEHIAQIAAHLSRAALAAGRTLDHG